MAYCAHTDILALEIILEELIALTDDGKTGAPDITIVNANIARADAEIDGYIKSHYSVPLTLPVPEEIKNLSATITAYWLFRRRNEVNESIFDAYIKALAKLKAISQGNYAINGITKKTDPSGVASTIASTVTHEFTRTKKDSSGTVIGNEGTMEKW